MNQFDAMACRLRAAQWMAREAQAKFDRFEAEQRKDEVGSAAASLWAEICAMRTLAWQEEAERV